MQKQEQKPKSGTIESGQNPTQTLMDDRPRLPIQYLNNPVMFKQDDNAQAEGSAEEEGEQQDQDQQPRVKARGKSRIALTRSRTRT